MKLNLYALYNKKTGQYNSPVAVPYEKDAMLEHLQAQYEMAEGLEKTLLSESDLFFVGTYDTKNAHIDACNDFVGIIHIGGIKDECSKECEKSV